MQPNPKPDKSGMNAFTSLSPCFLAILLLGMGLYLLYMPKGMPSPVSNRIQYPFNDSLQANDTSSVPFSPPTQAYCLGMMMVRRGSYSQALDRFSRVTAFLKAEQITGPSGEGSLANEARYQAAVCLKKMGRRKDSVQAFDTLLKSNPPPETRSACLSNLKQLQQALPEASEQEFSHSRRTLERIQRRQVVR